MPDVAQQWGDDLQVTPTGDLALADGLALGVQRVLRRLLTNQEDYIWHPDYGAGLPERVGALLDITAIKSAIRAQIFQEDVVSRTPAPVITATQTGPGTLYVAIQYVDAGTGQQASVAFDLSP